MAPASDNNNNNNNNNSNNFVSAAAAVITTAASSFPSNNTATNNNNNNNNNNSNFNPLSDTLNLSSKKITMSSSQPVTKKEPGQSPTSSTTSTTTTAAVPSNTQTAKDKDEKPIARFENEGVVFKAKLIGSELVMEPRGDKMCQNSIQRLKAIIKGTNSHKKRILLKISFDGVKVYDEKTNEILHHHSVPQISYIASDDTDSRCFGYVGDVPSKAHQFICFKTAGPAIGVMSEISALFDAELERKKRRDQELKEQSKQEAPLDGADGPAIAAPVSPAPPQSQQQQQQQQQAATKHKIPYQHSEELSELFQQPLIGSAPTAPVTISAASQPVSQLPAPPPPVARQLSLNLTPAHEASAPRQPAEPAGLSLDGLNIKDELAGLNVQLPVASPNQTDNYVADRYAVFNEIDSWPSIFESNSSLNESASKPDLLSTSQQHQHQHQLQQHQHYQQQQQAQYLQYQNQPQLLAYQQQQYQQQSGGQLSASAFGQQTSNTAPVPFSLGTPSAGNMFESSSSLAERAGKQFFGAPPSSVASSAPFSFSMSTGPILRQKHPTIHRVATLGAPSMASHAHALASQSFGARSSASIGVAAMANNNNNNNNNNVSMVNNASSSSVFRQLNPFDDDFFA